MVSITFLYFLRNFSIDAKRKSKVIYAAMKTKKSKNKDRLNGRVQITVLLDPDLLRDFDAINDERFKIGGRRIQTIVSLMSAYVAANGHFLPLGDDQQK